MYFAASNSQVDAIKLLESNRVCSDIKGINRKTPA